MDGRGDASAIRPLRTSDRLRQRRKLFGRRFMYYKPAMRKKPKTKTRTAASQIAKLLRPRNRPVRPPPSDSIAANLRRSTRKRKISINLEDYDTDSSSSEDDDLMRPKFRSSKRKPENNASHDEISNSPKRKKMLNKSAPRREGLRPRRSGIRARGQPYQESEDEQDSSEGNARQTEVENGNEVEEDDGDEGDEAEGDGGDEGEEDGDDEDGEEQGRRRYDLRNRAEVRRFFPEKEGKQRPRSPRRVLHQGMGSKNGKDLRKGGPRFHKRHPFTRPEDSDDSLLVDELDQGPAMPWARSGSRSGPPWLFGGMDMHGTTTTAWGLNVAASGWVHQGDSFPSLTAGAQTAGPSSKGGADIQPLQVDESVSFNDIGGLSEYIDALKEMVFFPLLYPDFFSNYHITPPRGVLLCGPPGTGKTLIARALACAASKAGQKVSFYMRKGADVLSKWVGEAERQLKLLFEEAQRNQPSIIFFDEIDGLAPVRSSKQEQIHNSIVSTLLALMDGLDSRGQVVLIGATNRIDAIDGALRRPGRFDREFIFPLPGCEARAEILDIHTRKWKEPLSKDLKMELAASCVGYCGADLKALCTEAAIRAFREKYPQVYTSDDKFVIDVDSIKVEKYHFLEAMSTITPAAHRGSIVHSRPLSPILSSCLKGHLMKIMGHISDIFPYHSASDTSKLAVLSYCSAFPLVYRPRLLLCGNETVGLDHVGPAVLHELEKFPVHSLGLPSLLSDPSAKTPEEALVHIFGEARRSTPSILFLPQFQLWWETANEQLKSVLMTLLGELPSDLPVLLLGTSTSPSTDLDEESAAIFAPQHVYQVEKPTRTDMLKFFEQLVESVFSFQLQESRSNSKEKTSLPELPKAPKEISGPKPSEMRAKAEAEQHALRRLRMCLRDVCNRILYDKRFSVFHYPVTDEDAPNYRSIIQNPMDMATLLQRVDSGQYLTCSAFLRDVDLIAANAKAYNGDDYNGARIVSRAHELRDAVQGMLSQMDPALVSFCDKIAADGGPVQVADDIGISSLTAGPVVQLTAVTRSSARLRHVQPEVNLQQSYEALKRPKKITETEQAASIMEDKSNAVTESETSKSGNSQPGSSQELQMNGASNRLDNPSHNELSEGLVTVSCAGPTDISTKEDVDMADAEISEQITSIKHRLMERAEGYGVPELERLYMRIVKGVIAVRSKEAEENHRLSILRYLLKFVEDDDNF
ncbi:ATPase family AAA domain-containing protein At1g05910 isoform X1 [Dioscorea cayenensis subsp. rotundata]|uniref:ATPase family AAA domain-containing protein At1g05910 isoform X1 n=2 Tax=Dioscorea cayennensis subsp. rotundata TaxID=55577 RepID=A0AB40C2F9_DIOCR|nr:ATPase family AAA domain-containing protein At1g05910 isoform X1 [Dioscorea cayenensis subsp. rotundata]XP_039133349.1 ATPase family AAA domain-containing protein At1g05910 isoform X1 [Dioscorea cayenensis subsp. rotundata]